jgi:hypothetical protein
VEQGSAAVEPDWGMVENHLSQVWERKQLLLLAWELVDRAQGLAMEMG